VRVGVIGTGFVAKLRVQALLADSRVAGVAVAGRSRDRSAEFCAAVGGEPVDGWRSLLADPEIKAVFVASVNGGRGALIRSLLEGDRHVVTEYPLALDPIEAAGLIDLAAARGRLLHVEHIELLGGVHRSLKTNIKRLGSVAYGRYCTIAPRSPAPEKWTYAPELFGFPLVGALSRLHRLVDVLGPVASVAATVRYGPEPVADYYRTVWCAAQLRFGSGAIAEVLYAKGEGVGPGERRLEMRGDRGALIYDGDAGRWIGPEGTEEALPVEGRRGLFAVDTAAAIAAIVEGKPLYVSPQESLYTLQVADAARRSAETGRAIALE